MSTKPILFNTEMVQAILDGRKTVTRRLVKPRPGFFYDVGGKITDPDNPEHIAFLAMDPDDHEEIRVPPYQPGDVLYVRETWRIQSAHRFEADAKIEFKAGGPMTTIQFAGCCSDSHERVDYDSFISKWWSVEGRWRPSIFMPKEAARIFLRVKDVRAERLQDITVEQVAAEGVDNVVPAEGDDELCNYCPLPDGSKGVHCYGGNVHMCEGSHCKEALEYWEEEFIGEFAGLWESTIKDKDIGAYGWDANPWVWVIEYEKISKEEAMEC